MTVGLTLNVEATIVVVVGILALAVVLLAALVRVQRTGRLRVGFFVERDAADDVRPDDPTEIRPPPR